MTLWPSKKRGKRLRVLGEEVNHLMAILLYHTLIKNTLKYALTYPGKVLAKGN